MYFYFSLIHNFNTVRVKKKQMIQLLDEQIHKVIFGEKKIYKEGKD